MSFALRIKTKTGQQLLKDLTPEHTIKDLKVLLSTLSEIPEDRLHVLSGFPPKVFDISQDKIELNKSGLKSGDTLILEEKAPPPAPVDIPPQNELCELPLEGILMKKVVPADNSCLFGSIYFALNGSLDEDGSAAAMMRQMVAHTVASEPSEYSEAILGKPNEDYCKWILNEDSWGGAIELSIFANHYGMEIAVVDTVNAIINTFGEDKNYLTRIYLLFDGIHYDPLYLETPSGSVKRLFEVADETVLKQALELAQEANSSRQYTDVNKFTLKCMICGIYLNGQVQAREHAQSTGHTNFGEV